MLTVLNSSVLESKIVDGRLARDNEKKYMASLQLSVCLTPNSDLRIWNHFCGSTLISFKFLLTAAACIAYMDKITGKNYFYASAVVGANNLLSDEIHRLKILLADVHPLYYSVSYEKVETNYDVGVVMVHWSISFYFV